LTRLRSAYHDPGLLSLRRAARVAVVVPIALALGYVVLDNVQTALFAAFGAFAPLVFAHFGGPPWPRARAYAVTMLAGAVLVVLGTALTDELIPATIGAFAVGLGVRIAATFGGYVEGAGLTLILAYVLAVTVAVPFDEVTWRLIGWLGAGVLVTLAAVTLWPRYERANMMRCAADACRALAAAALDPARVPAAIDSVERFRDVCAHTPNRPAGPSARDRALILVIDQLFRLGAYIRGVASAGDDRLVAQIGATLEATADRLDGGDAVPDLLEIERAREAHREQIGDQVGSMLAAGAPVDDVIDRLDSSFGPRLASYAAMSAATNTLILTGEAVPPNDEFEIPPDAPPPPNLGETIRFGIRELRHQFVSSSPRFQDAVRGAIGIAIAVFIAIAAALGHAFWVVLGTLAVLRSNAAGTGRTAVQAILGTTVGFIAGSALMLSIGTGETGLWIALPITVFLAGYCPTAIHFVVGQAAFTVFVVVLFNLVDPVGWEVGLVRVEDVAIGATVSLVVGVLVWPRGGREALRRSAAAAYRTGASYLEDGFHLIANGRLGRDREADRIALAAATHRSVDSLRQHLGEPGAHLPENVWRMLLVGPRHLRAAGDSTARLASRYAIPVNGAAPRLAEPAGQLGARYVALGDALDAGSPDAARATVAGADGHPAVAAREQVKAALERWRGSPDREARDTALVLAWARDWMLLLEAVADDVANPVAALAASAAEPWWRR